jgi:hypothetical protein
VHYTGVPLIRPCEKQSSGGSLSPWCGATRVNLADATAAKISTYYVAHQHRACRCDAAGILSKQIKKSPPL